MTNEKWENFQVRNANIQANSAVLAAIAEVNSRLSGYIDSHERLNTRRLVCEMERTKQELGCDQPTYLKKALVRDLKNLSWSLDNQEILCRLELSLEYPVLVQELKRTKNGWVAKIWYSPTEMISPVEVEDHFVQSLLTPHAYRRGSVKKKFGRIGKYDRQETVDETHFRQVRRSGEKEFIVTDVYGKDVKVTYDWAMRNLDMESVAESHIGGGPDPLPLGSAPSSGQVTGLTVGGDGLPKIQFQNTKTHCLVTAMASGMFFRGYTKEAATVASGYSMGSIKNNGAQMKDFRNLVLDSMKDHKNVRFCKPRRIGRERYNPLDASHQRMNPIVVKLKANSKEDGKGVSVNHAVCFVGEYLFDPNQATAMLISKQSLDTVCSSIVPGTVYGGIYTSYELFVDHLTK